MELTVVLLIVFMAVMVAVSPVITGTQRWFNPLTAFNVPHIFLLVCYLIGIEREVFYFILGDKALFLLVSGYVSFDVGVVSFALIANKSRLSIRSSWNWQIKVAQLLVYASLVLMMVSVTIKYFILLRTYGNILSSIVAIRLDYVSGALNYSVWNTAAFVSCSVLMVNLGVLMGSSHGYPFKRLVVVLTILFVIANDVTIGGANWTFSSLCLFICSFAITKEHIAPIKIGVRIIRGLAVTLSLAAGLVFLLLYFRSEGELGGKTSFSDIILYYAGGDIATFGYFVDFPYSSEPSGRYTFGGLYGIVNSVTSILTDSFLPYVDPEDYVAEIGMGRRSNTSIHMAHYYCDFGGLGVIAGNYLLGFVVMWLMSRYCRKATLLRLQYISLMLFTCVISIRSVPSEGKYFWLLLLIFPVLVSLGSAFLQRAGKGELCLETSS